MPCSHLKEPFNQVYFVHPGKNYQHKQTNKSHSNSQTSNSNTNKHTYTHTKHLDDTLDTVCEIISEKKIHRLFVVENEKPTCVLSLSDVMFQFIKDIDNK